MLKPVNTSIKELNDKEEKASSSKGFAKKKRELTVNGFQLNKNISKKLFKSQKWVRPFVSKHMSADWGKIFIKNK